MPAALGSGLCVGLGQTARLLRHSRPDESSRFQVEVALGVRSGIFGQLAVARGGIGAAAP
jgi:hypothetical protein